MGWNTENGRRYYTRSRCVNGRVVREYLGGGVIGELAAQLDAQRRAERRAAAETVKAGQAHWRAALAPSDAMCKGADLLFRLALMTAGYHQHDRGHWRKRRHEPNAQTLAKHGSESSPGAADDRRACRTRRPYRVAHAAQDPGGPSR